MNNRVEISAASPASRLRLAPSRRRSLLAAASLILLCATAPAMAQESEQRADAVLKEMSDYLGKTQNLTMKFNSDVEVIAHGGQTSLSGLKLQFSAHGNVMLSRPSKLRATRTASYGDVEFVSDGKTITVLGKKINTYAQADASETVDKLIDDVRNYTGAEFPGADLLFSDVYGELSEPVENAIYVGSDIVDGVDCHHLAFRTSSVDWQLWVQKGPKPIPRKYIITSKWITGAPQFQMRITEWNDSPAFKPDTFVFKAPEGAKTASFDELEGIADLPLPAAIGGR